MAAVDNRFRNKITAIKALLSVGIVYQHTAWNYSGNLFVNGGHLFLFYLRKMCVPFFFMISGYLFYRTYESSKVKKKILSKGRTLLVPYLLWNAIYAVFMVTLIKLGFITNAAIPEGAGELIVKLLNSEFSPLWFLKYLMIFTLIAPVMYYVLRRKVMGALAIAFMILLNAWSYYSGVMQIPLNLNSNDLVMLNYQYIFYAVGAYGALNWGDTVEQPSKRKAVAGIAVIITLILTYFAYLARYANAITSHTFRLLFIIALWFGFDIISEIKVYPWMENSFFLYCSHLMVLQCLQRVCDILIERMDNIYPLLYVAEYCILPIIVIAGLMIIAKYMKKRVPRLYGVMTGSR